MAISERTGLIAALHVVGVGVNSDECMINLAYPVNAHTHYM